MNVFGNAITAEKVREMREHRRLKREAHDEPMPNIVLRALLSHPGVSSSARAVIEAMLEPITKGDPPCS